MKHRVYAGDLQFYTTKERFIFPIRRKPDLPNMTKNTPPMTGSGMVTNSAPNFPRTPKNSKNIAASCTTLLLPTYIVTVYDTLYCV